MAMKNVDVICDEYDRERPSFGVATSGQVLLYDPNGELRYSGGITRSRGHPGANAGRAAIESLYHAALDEHRPTATAKPQVDPDGIDPPIPPSGPMCQAELPRRIHVEVPGKDADVQFRYEDVAWNPPLTPGLFVQPAPNGVEVVRVTCDE